MCLYLQGGKFFFLEHVRADPKSWLYQVQRAISPLWKKIADGCHFTNTPWLNIQNAGFDSLEVEHFVLEKFSRPNLIGPHVLGVAVK